MTNPFSAGRCTLCGVALGTVDGHQPDAAIRVALAMTREAHEETCGARLCDCGHTRAQHMRLFLPYDKPTHRAPCHHGHAIGSDKGCACARFTCRGEAFPARLVGRVRRTLRSLRSRA